MNEYFKEAKQLYVDEFTSEFENIESSKPFKTPSWPLETEAKQLAQLPLEISIIQFKNGQNYLVKGISKTKTALTRENLLALPISKQAHTHPFQSPSPKRVGQLLATAGLKIEDIDYDALLQFFLSLPSPEDLTLATLEEDEIWNIYGKTLIKTPGQLTSDLSASVILMSINNLYHSPRIIRIMAGSDSIKDKMIQISEGLRPFEISFSFNTWNL